MSETRRVLAQRIAEAFGTLPQITAVALAGSQTTGRADSQSDIDLYVYSEEQPPVGERRSIMRRFAAEGELDNHFWEPADQWTDASSGITVDVMYRRPRWIETELEHVLERHEA